MNGVKEWKGFNVLASAVGDALHFMSARSISPPPMGSRCTWNRSSPQNRKQARSCMSRDHYDNGEKK